MEKLTKFFLERPLLVNLIIVGILVAGVHTVRNIKKEGFPSVSQNKVIITTIYPGAAARDVEINVTSVIEEELEDLSNVKEILSTSQEGASTISVVADDDLNEKQFDKFYDHVGNTLASIADLPLDIEGPTYQQVTTDDRGIIEIAVGGNRQTLRTFIPFLVSELRRVDGVSQITRVGFADEEYHILVDPEKANRHYVDLRQIFQAIRKRNVEGSGGTLESYIGEKKIVAYNKFASAEEVLDTNVRRSFEQKGVRVGDVAALVRGTEDLKLSVRNNGQEGVSLIIKKKSTADLIGTIDGIKAKLEEIRKPEGVTINLLNDQSVLTRSRIKLLGNNAVLGMALVFLILFVVLGGKFAFWTAFSIPLTFLGMSILLPGMGITLNSIMLGGCVLVLGMLVDDAIVVAEQVNREREKGGTPKEASQRAVLKVWQPILGSSVRRSSRTQPWPSWVAFQESSSG